MLKGKKLKQLNLNLIRYDQENSMEWQIFKVSAQIGLHRSGWVEMKRLNLSISRRQQTDRHRKQPLGNEDVCQADKTPNQTALGVPTICVSDSFWVLSLYNGSFLFPGWLMHAGRSQKVKNELRRRSSEHENPTQRLKANWLPPLFLSSATQRAWGAGGGEVVTKSDTPPPPLQRAVNSSPLSFPQCLALITGPSFTPGEVAEAAPPPSSPRLPPTSCFQGVCYVRAPTTYPPTPRQAEG